MVDLVLGIEENRFCLPLNMSLFLKLISASVGVAELLGAHEKLTDYYIWKYSKYYIFFVLSSYLPLSSCYLQSHPSKETSDRLTDWSYFYTVHILTVE